MQQQFSNRYNKDYQVKNISKTIMDIMDGRDSDLRDGSSVPLHFAKHEKTSNGVVVTITEKHEDDEKGEVLKPEYGKNRLIYGVDDRLPFTIALICAFQVSPVIVSIF